MYEMLINTKILYITLTLILSLFLKYQNIKY